MADLPTLKSLISRVAAATGPDRELDADICAALSEWKDLGGWWRKHKVTGEIERYNYTPSPHVTGSIDAAVALIERALPGWQINMKIYGIPGRDEACVGSSISGTWHKANSPALALIAALLSALISKAEARAREQATEAGNV